MKISFDIHGVIDHDPKFFENVAKKLFDSGHEVYIITGSTFSDAIDDLKKVGFNLKYITEIFSVTDYLVNNGHKWKLDKHKRPSFKKSLWVNCKAEIAKNKKIDFHIDDHAEYLNKFEISCALYDEGKFTIVKLV